ncbi:NAD(P)-binding protein [Lepidopterella palustris CBS 459.81]|uniref:NAD(P)-binding protein n=1 Tax=Lepidopterella palustris CBS 459.81 TaxID=1314670 RepID=A0A8E2EAM5_9PEZI|nr:NAD(P)-binding protein [Lepidopterella palustris CBS 459.81]
MSTEKKLLVVLGATGYQGGSVVRTLLHSPTYHIRAITRNPTSPSAQALASAGAELYTADLHSTISLTNAFSGAATIYLVTNFFDDLSTTHKEIEQGKRALDIAAKLPTLEHLIWSALPSITDVSGGKYRNVVHFDSKAVVTQYLKTKKDLWAKSTVLWIAPYFQLWEQMRTIFGPVRVVGEDGVERFVIKKSAGPGMKMPWVDVEETGMVVRAILCKGRDLGGKVVAMVGEENVGEATKFKEWGEFVKRPAEYRQITKEAQVKYLESLGLPPFLVTDMSEHLAAFEEFQGKVYHGPEVIQASEILPEGEKLKDWKEYLHTADWEPILQK